jgi:hypothetical protein
LAILRKLRNIQTLRPCIALHAVFAGPSHCAYMKLKVLLDDWKNYRALSLALKTYLGGFV